MSTHAELLMPSAQTGFGFKTFVGPHEYLISTCRGTPVVANWLNGFSLLFWPCFLHWILHFQGEKCYAFARATKWLPGK